MSKLTLLSLFAACVFGLSAFAAPKGILWGDWESAGNDVMPPPPPYTPAYPYSYDCQIEIEGEPQDGRREFLVANLTLDNESGDWFISDDLEWDVMRLNPEDGTLKRTGKSARDIFGSNYEINLAFGFLRGEGGSPDQLKGYLRLLMGVGEHWMTDEDSFLGSRDEEEVRLKTSVSVDGQTDDVAGLHRAAQVTCFKTK